LVYRLLGYCCSIGVLKLQCLPGNSGEHMYKFVYRFFESGFKVAAALASKYDFTMFVINL
jgi:hypothetical protein